MSIFGDFRDFGGILVILEVSGYFWSLGVYFNYFGGSKGYFVLLVVLGYFRVRQFVEIILGSNWVSS